MHLSRLLAALVVAQVLAAVTPPAPGFAQSDGPPTSSSRAEGFASELHGAMTTMTRAMDAAPTTGDPEIDFLAMMIPHHEGAIEMARLLLRHGRDPLVRQLAEEIIVTQQVEIQSMRNRLEILRAGPSPDPAASQALGGTRGASEAAPAPAPAPHAPGH